MGVHPEPPAVVSEAPRSGVHLENGAAPRRRLAVSRGSIPRRVALLKMRWDRFGITEVDLLASGDNVQFADPALSP
ncbi:hypothetical protein EYF80_015374 [Liparis tanakae]|uniref:Uncharacterized protein n=1 Tax=Liparis tanakae TaxID=230148 RepID=A0A4Z2IAI2_9TELE|nr:hypothetical protein EYF80_015374 [Liparis tanakae]